MLTQEQNERLTRVGPGTPMGALLRRYCAHRRADLVYGIPEDGGLRCPYHGWCFDRAGRCTEQPFEETVRPDSTFKERVRLAGYPVEELGGLIFPELGAEPPPLG